MKRYPPLPKTLMLPGGEVAVQRMPSIIANGHECWGTWEEHERLITIETTASLRHQWKVLFHEWTHAVLDDAGLSNIMSDEMVEQLCDAFATARHRERFG